MSLTPTHHITLLYRFHRIFWWEGKKFVGHCHSIMHEYETTSSEYEVIQFSSFPGGKIPGPPTSVYETLLYMYIIGKQE